MLTVKLAAIAAGGSAEWVLYLLIFLSVASVAVILERYFMLRSVIGQSRKIAERAKEALKANDLKVLEDLGRNHDALEGRLIACALRYLSSGNKESLEEIMNGYILMEKPLLEKNLAFLATLGSTAPFVGLLGTVLGIIRAFADLAQSAGNPTVVMAGISEALVATAVGLFVAIPAVAAYNFYQRQVKGILGSAESIKQISLAYVAGRKG